MEETKAQPPKHTAIKEIFVIHQRDPDCYRRMYRLNGIPEACSNDFFASRRKPRRQFFRQHALSILLPYLLVVGVQGFCPNSHRRHCYRGYSHLRSTNGNVMQNNGLFKRLSPKLPDSENEPEQSDDRTKISDMMQNATSLEMLAMGATGLALSVGVITLLATSGDPVAQFGQFLDGTIGEDLSDIVDRDLVLVEEEVSIVARNVLTAAMPTSATDVLAIALGEGIAGVIGALSTFLLNLLLRFRINPNMARMGGDIPETEEEILAEVVADGDYFLTRAAAVPLLEAAGVPIVFASLASVLLATVPYEFIKVRSRGKRERKEEDRLLKILLEEEKELELRNKQRLKEMYRGALFQPKVDEKKKAKREPETAISTVDTSTTQIGAVAAFDSVELFSDLTKWLEYDVLNNDFTGEILWHGQTLAPGVESAIFGFLAALSSQLYADTLYCYTNFGKETKRIETRTRKLTGWVSLYTTKCLNAAVLFGVYESVRIPVSQSIVAWFSGGVDSCLGSKDFQLCVDTYAVSNPPSPTQEAEFRALITTIVSLWDRLQTPDGLQGAQEFVRSCAVQFYSLALQVLPFTMDVVNTN